ncbi:hypothetical protein BJX64DRAFT_110037 [Aspergillus heterothallicus]
MGLAAPRKKTKISHDPNNTNWSRSTTGFGHKILSSQGWTPGSFLGARNAAHADMFTAASASHIRVIVKDDTLGLGARSKRDLLDEPTGLDAFKGLLGRLNGKSDAELQADQQKRDDVKLARYAATKWQTVRFVSAGLLTQEKNEESSAEKTQESLDEKDHSRKSPAFNASGEHNPKQSASDGTNTEADSPKLRERGDKKIKKSKKDKKEKREKKEKKRKRSEREEYTGSLQDSSPSSGNEIATASEAERLVKERRPLGRFMIRGRYIAQKKKALMDEKSLNEVYFLICIFPLPRQSRLTRTDLYDKIVIIFGILIYPA